jgi:hypothetical protein
MNRALAPANPRLHQITFSASLIFRRVKHLIAILAIASSPALLAQSPTPHSLAHRIDNHYNQLHSLRAAFTESYNGLGVRRAESGTLTLLKPGRMRWDYSSPAGKIFLLDGKFAWFYARGDAQVQRISSRDLDDLRSPLRFLLGHTELEKELANLRLAPAPNGQFTLTGQPKGPGKTSHRASPSLSPPTEPSPQLRLKRPTALSPASPSLAKPTTPPSRPPSSTSPRPPASPSLTPPRRYEAPTLSA